MPDKRREHNPHKPSPGPLTEPQWKGVVPLASVRELNERCLELISQMVQSKLPPHTPETIVTHRALWCGLDAAARHRAASLPVLLLDVNFANEHWWRYAVNSRTMERKLPTGPRFPSKIASELMQETMVIAWAAARTDLGAAVVLLGMAPKVATLVAELSPPILARIATRFERHLSLRYEDHPSFWRTLLRAAGAAEGIVLPSVTTTEQPASVQRPLF